MTAADRSCQRKDPTINPSFAEYAQSRGCFIDPARVRHRETKLVSKIRCRSCASAGSRRVVRRLTSPGWTLGSVQRALERRVGAQ